MREKIEKMEWIVEWEIIGGKRKIKKVNEKKKFEEI